MQEDIKASEQADEALEATKPESAGPQAAEQEEAAVESAPANRLSRITAAAVLVWLLGLWLLVTGNANTVLAVLALALGAGAVIAGLLERSRQQAGQG